MTSSKSNPKNLTIGIVTDIHHWYDSDGRLCSFGPYVREIDLWSNIFGKVIIAGGVGRGPMPNYCQPYLRQDLKFIPIYHVPGNSWLNRLKRIINIPRIAIGTGRIIKSSDLIHLRMPSFSSLIAMVLLRLTNKARIAKWASEFAPWRGEPVTSQIQRILLKNNFLSGPVMVYGSHTEPHLVSFFPAAMTNAELQNVLELSGKHPCEGDALILMVGRLVEAKGFDLGIQSLSALALRNPALPWRAIVIGEGRMREPLEHLSVQGGISDRVEFVGGKSFAEVLSFFARADVLLMPGQLEGFSKVLIEACASGTIPVATDVGLSPWILDNGKRGFLAKPNPDELSEKLEMALTITSAKRNELIKQGMEFAANLTLESFENKVRTLILNVLSGRC